jgi:hypothetical protein
MRQRPGMLLLIDFAAPTSLLREEDRPSTLPIIGNGPPGTFVLFPNGIKVSLPTDQIVFAVVASETGFLLSFIARSLPRAWSDR